MGNTAETVSRGELLDVRDVAIALTRFPEAKIKNDRDMSHAAEYLTRAGLVRIQLCDDWNGEKKFPQFDIQHEIPLPAEDDVVVKLDRSFEFYRKHRLYKPSYSITYNETVSTSVDGDGPDESALFGNRTGDTLAVTPRRRDQETAWLDDMYGEFAFSREKYEDLSRALGMCGTGTRLAVGKEAVHD